MTEFVASVGGILVPDTNIEIGGTFFVEHVRDGKIIDVFETPNLVVNEGLNSILGIMFNGVTQVTTWYVGLFEGNYTPVDGVTAATITANSTECVAYDEVTRVAYNEAAAAAQSISNTANKATFTFNATKTIYGAFLVSNSTKSGTTGTLFAATRFAASKAVVAADQLLVTYTLNASSV